MKTILSATIALCAATSLSNATVVIIEPLKDNSLYEEALGATSNGAGSFIFSGKTNGGSIRRALLEFDIAAAVPSGATINTVTLTLRLTQVASPNSAIMTLNTALAEWGEGTSSGSGNGAPSTPGDATWVHTFFNTSSWSTIGGDFSAAPSASTFVGTTLGSYAWSSAALAGDVQGWLDTPSSNHGWALLGDESVNQTARQFASGENSTVANRPQLTIDYTAVPEPGSVALLALAAATCSLRRRRR